MNLTKLLFAISFSLFAEIFSANANNAIYEQRRNDYVDTALSNFSRDAITLQAYRGVPLDTTALNNLLLGISTGQTSDFDIVKLIRILFFTNGTYDSQILPVLNQIPFWVTKRDTIRNYWSENHMIMWMSSDWLLHEKFGKAVDSNLDNRLRHYLHLKVDYGFYEFFSSVYAPYCLSGLINLADFAQDAEIKTLATQASQRLLKDILILTNDKGVFFPSAGRNYYGKYETPYGQNHNHLIYLLTGMGPAPGYASHAGGFLASSSIPVDSIISSWSPYIDSTYHIGHSLDSGFVLNSTQSPLDKTIFQWSSGAYFHPEVAAETAQLLTDSALWHQVDFAPFRPFETFSIPAIVSLCNQLTFASESSVICQEDVVIYKHKSITLSSVKDFWKGKVGYQQFPCVANVGTTAVLTAAGKIVKPWDNRSASNASEHLPYVNQKKNIALLMYRSEPVILLPFHNPEVALFFQDADYDEVRTDSMWLLGRQQNSYVAVRRSCIGEIDSVRACNMNRGQAWVIMVGDSDLYGSFNNFQNIVHQSQFEEKWYYDTTASQSVYYAKIVMDTTTIDYAWGVDSLISAIENIGGTKTIASIYPNPATEIVYLDVSSFVNQQLHIQILNLTGQEVYSETMPVASGTISFGIHELAQGIYTVIFGNELQKFSSKLIKTE